MEVPLAFRVHEQEHLRVATDEPDSPPGINLRAAEAAHLGPGQGPKESGKSKQPQRTTLISRTGWLNIDFKLLSRLALDSIIRADLARAKQLNKENNDRSSVAGNCASATTHLSTMATPHRNPSERAGGRRSVPKRDLDDH